MVLNHLDFPPKALRGNVIIDHDLVVQIHESHKQNVLSEQKEFPERLGESHRDIY